MSIFVKGCKYLNECPFVMLFVGRSCYSGCMHMSTNLLIILNGKTTRYLATASGF